MQKLITIQTPGDRTYRRLVCPECWDGMLAGTIPAMRDCWGEEYCQVYFAARRMDSRYARCECPQHRAATVARR